MEGHIAHLVIVKLQPQTAAEQLFDERGGLKFTVEQGTDIIG